MGGQMLTSKVSTLAPPPPLPLSSLHSSGPREICIMSMSRGLFGRRKEGGRDPLCTYVALLMSLPDIRDGAFQRKIPPHRKTIASKNTFAMFQCRARSLAVGRSLSDGHCTRKVIGKRA